MTTVRFFLAPFLITILSAIILRADDANLIANVRTADDARVAAMIAVDPKQLEESLSDQLHYAHSERLIQTKTEFVEWLVTKRMTYRSMDYKTRDFSVVSPNVVVMKGQALAKVGTNRIFLVDINFLAVWRLENDRWRLYAWQSSRNEDPTLVEPSIPAK